MNPHLTEDTDDENCDDPIKLFDNDLNAVYYGSKPLAIRDITDTENLWRSETIANNGYFQPRENLTLLKPDDDPVEKIQSSTISEFDITPLCIKLVNCEKFPWYFSKKTQQILEKINSKQQHKDSEHDKDEIVVLDDSDDCYIVEDLKNVTNKIITSTAAKAKSPGKMININKNKINKHFEILKRRKADAEIKRAISAKNLVQVDLKRNQGLIGMKIVQKIETNKTLNIKAEGENAVEKTEANQQCVTADDKYVSAVDKTLGHIGTQLIPIIEENESFTKHPFTIPKKDLLGKPNLLKSPSSQNITVQFDISKISDKLLDNLKSKKIIDQSSEAQVLSQSSQFLQNNPENKIKIWESSKAKVISQTNRCLLENLETQNNVVNDQSNEAKVISQSKLTVLNKHENEIKTVNDKCNIMSSDAKVISVSNQTLLKSPDNKIKLVNDQSSDAKVNSHSNQTLLKKLEGKITLVNEQSFHVKVINPSNPTLLKNPENKIKLVNEQSSDAKFISQPSKTLLKTVENKIEIVNDQLFEAKDISQSNLNVLKYPEKKTKKYDEKDLSSNEIITEKNKKSSVQVTSHVKDMKKTNIYKKYQKKVNNSSIPSSLVGLLVTNQIKEDIKETQNNKQKIITQAIQSINTKIVKKPRKKTKKQKSELKSPILPCSAVLKKTKNEIPLNSNKSDTNSNLSKELGRLAKIVDKITNSCTSMLDSNRPKPIVYPRKTPKSFDVPRTQSLRKRSCEMPLKIGSLSNVPVKPLKVPDKLPDICIDIKPNIDFKNNFYHNSRIVSSSQNNTLNEQNEIHEPQQNNVTKHLTNTVTNPTPKIPVKNNKPTTCNSIVTTTTVITVASGSESVPLNKDYNFPTPHVSDVPTHDVKPSKMSNSNIPHKNVNVPVQNCNAPTPILKSNNHTSLPSEKYCEPSAQTIASSRAMTNLTHSQPSCRDSHSPYPKLHPPAPTVSPPRPIPNLTHSQPSCRDSHSPYPKLHPPAPTVSPPRPIPNLTHSQPPRTDSHPPYPKLHSPAPVVRHQSYFPNSVNPAPNQFRPPSNQFQPPRNQFHPPSNQLHPPRNQFHPPSNQLHPSRNQFHPPSNQFHPRPNQFHPRPNQFHPRQNQFHPRPNQLRPPQGLIGQQASNPMQDFYRECWLPQDATGHPQPPPLMSINIPPRNCHDLNRKAPIVPNPQNASLQTSVTKPQVQNSSIIGMNNDGLVKKINIVALPAQNNANTNKGIIKVEQITDPQIMSPTEEKEVVATKMEMLKELDNLSFVDGNSFKEMSPATIINGNKNNSTLEVAIMSKKPGRFESLKLTVNDKDNRLQSQEPAKGYSPPILPIPTYQNVLSGGVMLNSLAQNVKPKLVVPPRPENLRPNLKSETKPMRKRDFVKCCKRKLAWTNDEEKKRSEYAKKISLEEYKKRIEKNDCKSNNNRNFIKEKFKNRKKGDSTESDLGYDSDSTVVL